jgi:hypothetical protein
MGTKIGDLKPVKSKTEEEYKKDTGQDEKPSNGGITLYYPRKGITVVRFLPSWNEAGELWKEMYEHYFIVNGQKKYSICRGTFKKNCPVCEKGKKLYSSGDLDDLAEAKSLRPKPKYLFNVIIMSDPEGNKASDGVRVMKLGVKVKQPLASLQWDFSGGWGDMASIENGFDVRIERRGDTMQTTEYFVQGVPKRTNLVEVLKSQGVDINQLTAYNLDEVLECPDEEIVMEKLAGNFVPGFPRTNSPVEVEATPPPTVDTPSETVVKSSNPVQAPEVPEVFTTEEK